MNRTVDHDSAVDVLAEPGPWVKQSECAAEGDWDSGIPGSTAVWPDQRSGQQRSVLRSAAAPWVSARNGACRQSTCAANISMLQEPALL